MPASTVPICLICITHRSPAIMVKLNLPIMEVLVETKVCLYIHVMVLLRYLLSFGGKLERFVTNNGKSDCQNWVRQTITTDKELGSSSQPYIEGNIQSGHDVRTTLSNSKFILAHFFWYTKTKTHYHILRFSTMASCNLTKTHPIHELQSDGFYQFIVYINLSYI